MPSQETTMDISEVCDLPFSMEIPEGCSIKKSVNPLNRTESSITAIKKTPKFFLNLIWGKTFGNLKYSPPPGYTLVGRGIVGLGSIQASLLVVKSSAFMGAAGFVMFGVSAFWAIIIGLLCLVVLAIAKQNLQYAIPVALLIFVINWLYILAKEGPYPSIKYAFVYKDVEYVITGVYRQRDEIEKCINSIRFKPEKMEDKGGE